MNPRFINSYITSQKFLWITLKHAQTLLRRNHTSPLLWSAVSKRGTHLSDSFLMPKHSCKMYHTRPTEMFTVSLILRTFNRRSLSTMSLILSIISWDANTAATKFSEPLMNHATHTKLAFLHGFILTMKNQIQLAVKKFLINVLTWNFVYALLLDGILLE